jgi:Protein of unknown function (DUF3892)
MARPYRQRAITFVNLAYSHDPHERIERIGGVNADRSRWSLSQAAAIALIEAGTDEFFVGPKESAVKVVVVTHKDQKYLESEREKTHPNDLMSLPSG